MPERVGPYLIEKQLGEGGMGAVYRAHDERLHRRVAVKRFLPGQGIDDFSRQRLKREARLIAGLSHPAIVQIYDIVAVDGDDWIVMELVEGETLHTLLADGPLPLPQVYYLALEIAEALAEAHGKGIVHRDLKTENVMVTPSGHTKILDFGLAADLDSGGEDDSLSAQTRSGRGILLGTGRAMSPEQVMGEPVDQRSDLFSFGTMLYEMTTGTRPFERASLVLTLAQVCAEDHVPARQVDGEVPEQLSKLIDRLLAKDPAQRPRSARRVAEDLARLAGIPLPDRDFPSSASPVTTNSPARASRTAGEPAQASPTAVAVLPHPAPESPAAVSERQPGSAAGPAQARRMPLWKPALAMVALASVAAAAFFVAARSSQPARDLPAAAEVVARARPSVAVLGFKNLSGKPESSWLSTALAELFASELAAGERLRLIPGESVARLKMEMALADTDTLAGDTLRKIWRNLGTDYVVLGSYLRLEQADEPRIRLQLRMQETRTGENVASISETGSEAELFELVSRAGTVLRRKLDLGEISSAEAAAVRATLPGTPEATRLYSEGLAKLRSFDALGARKVLEEAIASDPDYALAHAALSRAWSALGFDRQAEASASRAFELAAGLPRKDYLWIEGHFQEAAGDWPAAIETHRVLWGFFPDNVDYGLRLARAQIAAGRGREALATVAALRALPLPARDDARIDMVEAEASGALSDYRRALEAVGEAIRKGQAREAAILVAEARRLEGFALYHLGRLEEAVLALEEAKRLFTEAGDSGKVAEVLTVMAYPLSMRGNLSESEEILRQALAIHRRTGSRKGVAQAQNGLAYMIQAKGDLAGALPLLEEAVASSREIGDRSGEAVYLDSVVWVLLQLGEIERARKLAEETLELCDTIGKREGTAYSHYYLGQLAFDGGRLQDALDHYERALRVVDEIDNVGLGGYIRRGQLEVYLRSGDLEQARTLSRQLPALPSELGESGEEAANQLTRARLRLALDQAADAGDLARQAAEEFRRAERRSEESAALNLLLESRLELGKIAEAEALLSEMEDLSDNQDPRIRTALAINAARLDAARGRYRQARERLAQALTEIAGLGLVALELDVRSALGEIEMAAGDVAAGRARLAAVRERADGLGFGLTVRRIDEALR